MVRKRNVYIACFLLLAILFSFLYKREKIYGFNNAVENRIFVIDSYTSFAQDVGFDTNINLFVIHCGNKLICYSTAECYYKTDGIGYYRNLTTEETYVYSDGIIRPATDAEILKMSEDVWIYAGVDIRRIQLISNDLSSDLNFGVSNDWSPGLGNGTGECQSVEDDYEYDENIGYENNPGGGDDGDGEAVPTPDPITQPEPEVPIVVPIIESYSFC